MRLLTVATVSCLLALSACDSEEDKGPSLADAGAPAKLDTTEAVLQSAGYLLLTAKLDGLAESFTTFGSPLARKAQRMAPKATLTDAECPGGGSFDFTDQNRDDYLQFRFDNCITDDGDRSNGLLELVCLSGTFEPDQDDSCSNTRISFGDGNRALVTTVSSGEVLALRGTFRLQTTSRATITDQTLDVETRSEGLGVVGITRGLNRDIEPTSNGGALVLINGDTGVALQGDDIECATGLVSIATLDRLQVNPAGAVIGGSVSISNDDNQTATVSFSSDGSVTVNLDGSTQTFPRTRFEALCDSD